MYLRLLVSSLALLKPLTSANPVDARQSAPLVHPGVFVSQAQLTFTKNNLKSLPWSKAYKAMDDVNWGRLDFTPQAFTMVRCEDPESPEASQEQGCVEERENALNAYSMALRWAYTGQTQYANKAIQIFDLWSNTIQGHTYSTFAREQAGLQCGWVAGLWTKAGEIVRHTGAGWSSSSITKFENMLKTVYLPEVRNGSAFEPNNIDLALLEAAQGIAIFTNDRTLYTATVNRLKQRVPSYIYLSSDGADPVPPAWSVKYTTTANIEQLWQYDETYFTGRAQETCRDLEHTSYGLASISHMLETAYIQGDNLYNSDISTRLKAAFEFHSPIYRSTTVASDICDGTVKPPFRAIAEPFYNGYVNRAGNSLPNTKKFIDATRPAGPNYIFTAWETLTHGSNGR